VEAFDEFAERGPIAGLSACDQNVNFVPGHDGGLLILALHSTKRIGPAHFLDRGNGGTRSSCEFRCAIACHERNDGGRGFSLRWKSGGRLSLPLAALRSQ
jgi:hypothetical protein